MKNKDISRQREGLMTEQKKNQRMADAPKRQKGHRIWLAGRDSATQVYESH
jgi:hypothetical protein